WARDGEGMSVLSAEGGGDAAAAAAAAAAETAAGSKGVVKVPDVEKGGKWVDVIEVARGSGGQEAASPALN
ncbi:hypothetical protein RJZ90_007994, partial [Blastomyces dermatitidis]